MVAMMESIRADPARFEVIAKPSILARTLHAIVHTGSLTWLVLSYHVAMPPVSRVRPLDVFAGADLAALRRVSRWRGLALVLHAWLVVLTVLALATWADSLLAGLLAVPLIGGRQLGLAILMHEAAHGLLHPDRRINEFVGKWLCAVPVGADLAAYRRYHFEHHRFTQQPEDPDLVLSAPFPTTPASLGRKLWRDLSGQTFFRQRIARSGATMGQTPARDQTQDKTPAISQVDRDFLLFNLGLSALLYAIMGPWSVLLWWLAMITWMQLALRIRNIAEHACTATGDDPFSHARTTTAGWVARALVAPYFVNHHAEHHLFTFMPCYSLPRAHGLLKAAGLTDRMTIAPSYGAVLRQVTRPLEMPS